MPQAPPIVVADQVVRPTSSPALLAAVAAGVCGGAVVRARRGAVVRRAAVRFAAVAVFAAGFGSLTLISGKFVWPWTRLLAMTKVSAVPPTRKPRLN